MNIHITSRIEKFNDRRQTLALLDLAKHTVLSNSFRDTKMPGGPEVSFFLVISDGKTQKFGSNFRAVFHQTLAVLF